MISVEAFKKTKFKGQKDAFLSTFLSGTHLYECLFVAKFCMMLEKLLMFMIYFTIFRNLLSMRVFLLEIRVTLSHILFC